jgi:hypothetical protein
VANGGAESAAAACHIVGRVEDRRGKKYKIVEWWNPSYDGGGQEKQMSSDI